MFIDINQESMYFWENNLYLSFSQNRDTKNVGENSVVRIKNITLGNYN